MELLIDTSIAQQRFTTDCEICCRPFEVFAGALANSPFSALDEAK
jgi:hypothetical protein